MKSLYLLTLWCLFLTHTTSFSSDTPISSEYSSAIEDTLKKALALALTGYQPDDIQLILWNHGAEQNWDHRSEQNNNVQNTNLNTSKDNQN